MIQIGLQDFQNTFLITIQQINHIYNFIYILDKKHQRSSTKTNSKTMKFKALSLFSILFFKLHLKQTFNTILSYIEKYSVLNVTISLNYVHISALLRTAFYIQQFIIYNTQICLFQLSDESATASLLFTYGPRKLSHCAIHSNQLKRKLFALRDT